MERDNKAFVTLDAENAPVILIASEAADYHHDFAAFTAAVKSQPVRCTDGVLRFAGITFYGPSRLGEIDGKTVNLAPSRGYDSPFIRSDWGSGLIYLRKGNDTEVLDFRDSINPLKLVGVPVSSAFPPGIGSAQPIVFGKSAR